VGEFPATHEEKEDKFALSYESNQVSERYQKSITEIIQAKIYPILPLKPMGKLHLKIAHDGQVVQTEIAQSFGNPILDARILQRVKELKAFTQVNVFHAARRCFNVLLLLKSS